MRIQRILAPNPGLFTGPGTNTYVVGDDQVVVLDPGPVDGSHRNAIESAVGGREVAAVIVTHTHPDHAPLANPLARTWRVPAIGYRPGPDFEPDRLLNDGDEVEFGPNRLTAIHTPGHADDHLCFLAGGVLFTGDHIMGGSSVMIERLTPYLVSLERLQRLQLERLYPGHGPEIDEPQQVISWYIAHRLQREAEIVASVEAGASTVGEIVERVYREVDSSLHPLAARSVEAHLEKLVEERTIRVTGGRITLMAD